MPAVRASAVSLAVLSALLGAGSAQATVLDLMAPVGGANVYAIHDFISTSSDVQGAIVAGGNVSLSSYSVNALNRDAFGSKDYAVVAGGKLELSNGSINNGIVYAGGGMAIANAAPVKASASNPVDFKAAESYYKTLATALDQLDPTGSVTRLWSGVKVSGSGKGGVDVFDVSADMFASSSSWTLDKLVPGETLIFNVSGKSGSFNGGGIDFSPLSGYNVLFNFYEATSVNAKGLIGSLLAPYATMSENWGVINGNVVIGAWNSTVQINANHYFTPVEIAALSLGGKTSGAGPSVPKGQTGAAPGAQVPEPGSIALLLAGLGAAWRARRRPAARPR